MFKGTTHTHTHTHPFNGPFSRTNLDCTEARDTVWQWHQLGHMQVCISLQTDNHASTPPLSFFTGQMLFLPPNQHRQSTEGTFKGTNWQLIRFVKVLIEATNFIVILDLDLYTVWLGSKKSPCVGVRTGRCVCFRSTSWSGMRTRCCRSIWECIASQSTTRKRTSSSCATSSALGLRFTTNMTSRFTACLPSVSM